MRSVYEKKITLVDFEPMERQRLENRKMCYELGADVVRSRLFRIL